jgi:IS5 family transposase
MNFLEQLSAVTDWDMFTPVLEQILSKRKPAQPHGPGGRPAYHPLLLFKMLVVAKLYNLSDAELEFQCKDRRSFERFIGLTSADPIPDKNTVWNFRNALGESGVRQLFDFFNQTLAKRGVLTQNGTMIDASFVDVPRQRNTREENAQIKAGQTPEAWKSDANLLSKKDVDARWAKKNDETHFGYKNHIKADVGSKIILDYVVTDASPHDSQTFSQLVKPEDKAVYADSAYTGPHCEEVLRSAGVENRVMEKGARGRPLTETQKQTNTKKSATRVRVEHVFGWMTGVIGAMYQRYIGLTRNATGIGLTNLIYNLCRYEQIARLNLRPKAAK